MEKKKSQNQIGAEAENMEKRKYPTGPQHYTLFEEIGHGVSASVHRALCKPFNEIVAIKILDFERENCDLNNVFREAQTMVLIDHPNVLKSHCSFVSGHDLWVVMPFMAGGSCLNILKASHPDGLPEVVIATILREILKGLDYLHSHGHIHRDVKSGNILIDARGGIKLGDFGVSACLFDSGDRQRVRNTFVGTPCWMAPEVMEQLHGYDFKADIWSFGITALELAHGHAPFSRFPPMKVLLMTLQSSPPGLEDRKNDDFTTSFKHMVGTCLLKDPSRRPSAKKLLKHSFFKQARSSDYISRTLLEGLPTLGDRNKDLKKKDEAMASHKKSPNGEVEEMSQSEYKRGISGWYFDSDLLRASLNQDIEEEPISDNSQPESSNSPPDIDENEKQLKCLDFSEIANTGNNLEIQNQFATFPTRALDQDDEKLQVQIQNVAGDSSDFDEKTKEPIVLRRGRFKVTSESVDVEKVIPTTPTVEKSHIIQAIPTTLTLENSQIMQEVIFPSPQVPIPSTLQSTLLPPSSPSSPTKAASSNHAGCSLFSLLNTVLETNIVQRDIILSIMKHVASSGFSVVGDGGCTSNSIKEINMLEEAHEREKELLQEITDLRERTLSIQDERETSDSKTENVGFYP